MKLFPHQEDALNRTANRNRVAYFHDMGTGKTFTGAEKAVRMNARVNLVVCQKSKVQDWLDHFTTHYANRLIFEDWWIYDLTNKKDFQSFLFESQKLKPRETVVAVINYDLIWRRKELLQLKDFTLILDESSLIQNQKSNRCKFILKMEPANVILLSGSPTGGKYENLYSQIHLLGWDISEKVYNAHYVNWKKINVGGMVHKIVDKDDPYKNVERLKQKMREHGCDFLKTEEVFDLPEQTFIPVKVPITKEYKKFKRDRLITIDTKNLCEFKDDSDFYGKDVTPRIEFVGDSLLSYRLYLRQLCTAYNPNKLQAFQDILESTQDRLIVLFCFYCELEQLKSICHKLQKPISMINGSVKDLTAYERESNSVTLIQWQSGSMGLNLQKANKTVYFSLTESAEMWMQAHKRTNRIGQDRPCFYYTLLCENSIEELILNCLERGVDFTNELFEDCE